jgi:hypothetical protein
MLPLLRFSGKSSVFLVSEIMVAPVLKLVKPAATEHSTRSDVPAEIRHIWKQYSRITVSVGIWNGGRLLRLSRQYWEPLDIF